MFADAVGSWLVDLALYGSIIYLRGIMDASATQVQSDSLREQVHALLGAVDRVQAEAGELRRENEALRKQISHLRRDVG